MNFSLIFNVVRNFLTYLDMFKYIPLSLPSARFCSLRLHSRSLSIRNNSSSRFYFTDPADTYDGKMSVKEHYYQYFNTEIGRIGEKAYNNLKTVYLPRDEMRFEELCELYFQSIKYNQGLMTVFSPIKNSRLEIISNAQCSDPLTKSSSAIADERNDIVSRIKDQLIKSNLNPEGIMVLEGDTSPISINHMRCPMKLTDQFRTCGDLSKYIKAVSKEKLAEIPFIAVFGVNFPLFSQFSAGAQRAAINHEIQHLIHHDPLIDLIINEIPRRYRFTLRDLYLFLEFGALLREYRYLTEYRADLLASVASIEDARNMETFFSESSELYKHIYKVDLPTHPSYYSRHQSVRKLLTLLEREATNKHSRSHDK